MFFVFSNLSIFYYMYYKSSYLSYSLVSLYLIQYIGILAGYLFLLRVIQFLYFLYFLYFLTSGLNKNHILSLNEELLLFKIFYNCNIFSNNIISHFPHIPFFPPLVLNFINLLESTLV